MKRKRKQIVPLKPTENGNFQQTEYEINRNELNK